MLNYLMKVRILKYAVVLLCCLSTSLVQSSVVSADEPRITNVCPYAGNVIRYAVSPDLEFDSDQLSAIEAAADTWSSALDVDIVPALPPYLVDVEIDEAPDGFLVPTSAAIAYPLDSFNRCEDKWNDEWSGAERGQLLLNSQWFPDMSTDIPVSGDIDLQTLMLHEFAHILGVVGHVSGPGRSVVVGASPADDQRTLHPDDIADLAGEYGYAPSYSTGSEVDDGPFVPTPPPPPEQAPQHQVALGADGKVWFLSIKESGTAFIRYSENGTWSSYTQLGAAGSWTTDGSPALTVDNAGRVWVAITKASGTTYVRFHENGIWNSWEQVGGTNAWSSEAGLALVPRPNGTVMLAGVSSGGTLWHSTGSPNGFANVYQHGAANSWSTTGPPALAVDNAGRLWIAAVKQNGNLYTRYFDGSWSSFGRRGAPGVWAPDAGVSMTARSNGNVSFVAVDSVGSLFHATGNPTNWTGVVQHGVTGSWSTTATPEILQGDGELWIGAVKQNGTMYLRRHDGSSWLFSKQGINNFWSSDAGLSLINRSNGQVTLFSVTANGTLYNITGNVGSWTGLSRHGVPSSWAN